MKKIIISPSILLVDRNKIDEELATLEAEKVEFLHFDVMDGKFVPNTSFSVEDLAVISKKHKMVNDVHIMIENPKKFALDYIKNGADILTFHYEACNDENEVKEVIDIIRSNSCKVGLSIKPKTPISTVLHLLKDIDLLLIMSVEPGFGGQSFIPTALEKIATARKYIDENNLNCLIEVDGGINGVTGEECKKAGVDVLVAGSYLIGNENIVERIKGLRK